MLITIYQFGQKRRTLDVIFVSYLLIDIVDFVKHNWLELAFK